MEQIKFGLFGAGGFGREVMPFVRERVATTLLVPVNTIDVYFVETWQPKQSSINGHSVLSMDEFFRLEGRKYFTVAVGDGAEREAMVAKVADRAKPLTIFAPQAIILDCNDIGIGSVFCPNTMVTSNVRIGKFFQCNIYAYVAHDCIIGDFVTFAPGVRCNGRVHIDDYAYIGTNAIIRQGTAEKPLRIGKGAVIGMGAVVTKDVPAGATVVGNPARVMDKR